MPDQFDFEEFMDTYVNEPNNEIPNFTTPQTSSPARDVLGDTTTSGGDIHVSPRRSNEAPQTSDKSAGRAEDPITLTSVYELLNKYVEKVDGLEKELVETRTTLGGQIHELQERVKVLEAELDNKKKRKFVVDSEDDLEVPADNTTKGSAPLDALHMLAEASVVNLSPKSAPVDVPKMQIPGAVPSVPTVTKEVGET